MKPKVYRYFIDWMVEVCHNGQGAIGPTCARSGVWNRNATVELEFLADQFKMNQVLATLDHDQREVLAGMFAQAFVGGVFETLKALEQFEIEPFREGYEGSPYHDFIGRLAADQWQWPDDDEL